MPNFDGLRTGSTHSFTVLKLEDLEFTVKDELGHPLAWWYLVELANGEKKKGRLDANGHAKLEKVPKGRCQVKVTQDEPADPPPPPPPPVVAPPTTERPPPGESDASDARRLPLADGLGPIRGNDVEPDEYHPEEEKPADPNEEKTHFLAAQFFDRTGRVPAKNQSFKVEGKSGTTDGDGIAKVEGMPWRDLRAIFSKGEVMVPAVHDQQIVVQVRLRFLEASDADRDAAPKPVYEQDDDGPDPSMDPGANGGHG